MIALNRNQPNVPQLTFYADQMFSRMLQLRLLTSQTAKNPRDICDAILSLEKPEDIDGEIEECINKLKSAGLEDVGNSLVRLFSRKNALSAGTENIPGRHEAEASKAEDLEVGQSCSDTDSEVDENTQSRKRPRAEPFDVPDRKLLSSLKSTSEKVALIQKIHTVCQASDRPVNQYCSALKKLTYSVFKPILACLQHHCNRDVSEFTRKWGDNINLTDWGKKCCPGSTPHSNQCGWHAN
jgi:hypothetical protein